MTGIESFRAAAQSWQNFYLLVGAAAATLTGLMFVAVTFGSSLVTRQTTASARAFLDPTFAHFLQVLLTACAVTVPTLGPGLFGGLLLAASGARLLALYRIYGHMREAHRRAGDLEASDWVTSIVVPLLCHLLLAASGVGFLVNHPRAFDALGLVTVALLGIGIVGAWELLVWMAVAVGEKNEREAPAKAPGDRGPGAASE